MLETICFPHMKFTNDQYIELGTRQKHQMHGQMLGFGLVPCGAAMPVCENQHSLYRHWGPGVNEYSLATLCCLFFAPKQTGKVC